MNNNKPESPSSFPVSIGREREADGGLIRPNFKRHSKGLPNGAPVVILAPHNEPVPARQVKPPCEEQLHCGTSGGLQDPGAVLASGIIPLAKILVTQEQGLVLSLKVYSLSASHRSDHPLKIIIHLHLRGILDPRGIHNVLNIDPWCLPGGFIVLVSGILREKGGFFSRLLGKSRGQWNVHSKDRSEAAADEKTHSNLHD